MFTRLSKDMIKNTNKQPDEGIQRARSERVLSTRASVSMELKYITLPAC